MHMSQRLYFQGWCWSLLFVKYHPYSWQKKDSNCLATHYSIMPCMILCLTSPYFVCVATPICQSGMKTEELSCSLSFYKVENILYIFKWPNLLLILYYRVINKGKTKCEKYLKPMLTNTFLTRNNQVLHLKQWYRNTLFIIVKSM